MLRLDSTFANRITVFECQINLVHRLVRLVCGNAKAISLGFNASLLANGLVKASQDHSRAVPTSLARGKSGRCVVP